MVKLFGVEINEVNHNENDGTGSSGGPQDHGQKRRRTDSNCHQCHKSGLERVVKCSKCNRKNYCIPCITKWYSGMEEADFAEACAACRSICNCTACLRSNKKKELQIPGLVLSTEDRVQYSRHTVKILLPILKQMVAAESSEREEQEKVQELLKKAEEGYKLGDALEEVAEGACSRCGSNTTVLKAASRQDDADNYLYCLTAGNPCLMHFQWHLSKGEPTIAHEVLRGLPGLSWEPLVMWRACRQNKRTGSSNILDFDVINCSNWCQEKINMHQFLQGYSDGVLDDEDRPEILKLEDWPSSGSFSERLPQHYLEFLRCLPFKHYTHPDGCLNLKVLHALLKLDLGPKMSISYGADQGGAVTKLQYALSDRVNVLVHTAKLQDVQGSAEWDIFRRKDVPVLEDFLMRNFGESAQQGAHTVLGNVIYLTTEDKEKLKRDHGVEPWTFVQRLGDAVFLPAGCPFQIRNLKSCMSIAIGFFSPESIVECILQSEESQSIPQSHMYLEDQIQVKRVILHAVSHTLEYLDSLNPGLTR